MFHSSTYLIDVVISYILRNVRLMPPDVILYWPHTRRLQCLIHGWPLPFPLFICGGSAATGWNFWEGWPSKRCQETLHLLFPRVLEAVDVRLQVSHDYRVPIREAVESLLKIWKVVNSERGGVRSNAQRYDVGEKRFCSSPHLARGSAWIRRSIPPADISWPGPLPLELPRPRWLPPGITQLITMCKVSSGTIQISLCVKTIIIAYLCNNIENYHTIWLFWITSDIRSARNFILVSICLHLIVNLSNILRTTFFLGMLKDSLLILI